MTGLASGPRRASPRCESSSAGVLSTGNPDSSGYTAAGVSLQAGTHVVSLEAVDEDANSGADVTLNRQPWILNRQ